MKDSVLSSYRFVSAGIVLLVLGSVAALIYANSITVPFILDDSENIVHNTRIHLNELSLNTLTAIARSPSSNRPFANFTFALNYFFHQDRVAGYHAVNLMIHVITALLLYLLTRQTMALMRIRATWLPLAIALIWLAHPVHTQAVTYIVQRMTSLAVMLYLLALVCYVHARRRQSRPNRGGLTIKLFFAGSIVSAGLALGTKEIAATLPLFILLYEWFFFQDLDKKWLRRHIPGMAAAGLLLLLMAMMYLEWNPWDKIMATYTHKNFSPVQRLLTEPRVVIYYLSLIVFPHPARLTLDYDFPLSGSLAEPGTTLLALFALTSLLLLGLYAARKHRLLSFAVFWFLGTLAIESSFIGLALIFEHRTYLPSIFLFVAACYYIGHLFDRRRMMAGIICIMIVAVSGSWTWQRNKVWSDPVGLWQDTVNKSPNKASAWNGLGDAWQTQDAFQKALTSFNQAISLDPGYCDAWNNKGAALMAMGRLDSASGCLEKALTMYPDLYWPAYNLGLIMLYKGDMENAVAYFKQALRIRPKEAVVHNNLGAALMRLGRDKEALAHLQKALAIDPALARAHSNLGALLSAKGRDKQARRHFKQAIRYLPSLAAAYDNLAGLYKKEGRYEAAIDLYLQLAEQRPDLTVHTAYQLARIYARKSDPATAVFWLKKCVAAGFSDLEQLGKDEDLANIRSTPYYQSLMNPDHS